MSKQPLTPSAFAMNGTLQVLDDCTPDLTFAKANVYSGEKIKMGKERVTRHIVLPNYRLTRSSKSFSLYERVLRLFGADAAAAINHGGED